MLLKATMKQGVTHNMHYVAIVCPLQINEKVLRCKQWMKEQFGCVVALKSPAHITLVPPFWLEEAKQTQLQEVLGSFTSDLPETTINLEGFDHFRKQVLFINVKENMVLKELKKEAEAHFSEGFSNRIKKENRLFHPHITIANRDMKPSHFEEAWEYFSKKEFKETFSIKTISLLKLEEGKWNAIDRKMW